MRSKCNTSFLFQSSTASPKKRGITLWSLTRQTELFDILVHLWRPTETSTHSRVVQLLRCSAYLFRLMMQTRRRRSLSSEIHKRWDSLIQIFLSISNTRTDLLASHMDSSCAAVISVWLGQTKSIFRNGLTSALEALRKFTLAMIFDFHLERMSAQIFISPCTCSKVQQNALNFVAHRHSLSTFSFLKSASEFPGLDT